MKNELKGYMTQGSMEFFEALMGEQLHANHDFRVVLPAKAIQCYYQEADLQTSISFSFECLDSATFSSTGKISASSSLLATDGGEGSALKSIQDQRSGEIEVETEKAGIYGFCIDNSASGQPVTVQVVFDIWRMGEIPKYHKQQQESNNTMYHAFDGLFQVTRQVSIMKSAVTHTRSMLRYDFSARMSGLSRVTNFSILSIVLIVSVCFVQIRIVKKMFGSRRTGV